MVSIKRGETVSMLNFIKIKNFAIVESLELNFETGLTVVTGESGAGKSVLFEALNYIFGSRADPAVVRAGSAQCEITANFNVTTLPEASTWLQKHDLSAEDECIVRRVISAEGRSKAFINGTPVTLQMLRQMAETLVIIHGQHEHQALLQPITQLNYLDQFAEHEHLLQAVQQSYQRWYELSQRLAYLETAMTERTTRLEFLSFQLDELKQSSVTEGEYEQCEQEHKRLTNVDDLLQHYHLALNVLSEQETGSVSQQLHTVLAAVETLNDAETHLTETLTMLQQASIQVEESIATLQHAAEKLSADPAREQQVSQRLAEIQTLARKHRVKPTELWQCRQRFQQEYDELNEADENLIKLQQQVTTSRDAYTACANKLTQSRKRAATRLAKAVTEHLHSLGMPKARFTVQCELRTDGFFAQGLEHIRFLLGANPGQPMQPINKVASGGELSRISLAIHVVMMRFMQPPLILFDEVDVGVSGATAEVIGQLLRSLADKAQVLCVTHQPQVAALGHQHLQVTKTHAKSTTHATVKPLTKAERIEELARILGGIQITTQTRAHAKSLLGD